MRPLQYFREKWLDRVLQFGLLESWKQVFMLMISPFYRKNEDIIVAAPNHSYISKKFYPDVRPLTLRIFKSKQHEWALSPKRIAKIKSPLESGSKGFMIEIEGKLAGCAFIQFNGVYRFGFNGTFAIPEKTAVLKNQYVFRDFRGRRLTFQFNAARLASIPKDYIPIGFVMPENRYSIRSFKRYGFIEVAKVVRKTWLNYWTEQNIKIFVDNKISRRVLSGLEF